MPVGMGFLSSMEISLLIRWIKTYSFLRILLSPGVISCLSTWNNIASDIALIEKFVVVKRK